MAEPKVVAFDTLGAKLSLDSLHRLALSFGEKGFQFFGRCEPIFMIAVNDKLLTLEARWESENERFLTYALVAAYLHRVGAHAYAYISEAYTAAYKRGEPDKPMPKDLPPDQRDEILMITSFDRDGKFHASRYLITVRKRGLNFLGPRDDETMSSLQMSGAAWNLFNPEQAA